MNHINHQSNNINNQSNNSNNNSLTCNNNLNSSRLDTIIQIMGQDGGDCTTSSGGGVGSSQSTQVIVGENNNNSPKDRTSPPLLNRTNSNNLNNKDGDDQKVPTESKVKQFKLQQDEEKFKFDNGPMFSYGLRRRYRVAMYVFDWFFSIAAVLVGALLFYFLPVRGRLFMLTDHNISYPLVPELVTFPVLVVIALIIPIFLIFITTILHRRNWHDFHHAQLGLIQSVALTLMIVAIIKCFIGGLRPNFLVRCNPTPDSIAAFKPVGYGGIYYSPDICTGPKSDINDAMSSHPSGHAGLAACGLVYLALFLHARLKTFNNRGHLFIYVLLLLCITGAMLVGVSRLVDYRHTFANVIEGWFIGTVIALSMYRLNFLSIFGPDNHIAVCDFWYWHWKRHHPNNDVEQEKEKDKFEKQQNDKLDIPIPVNSTKSISSKKLDDDTTNNYTL